MHICYRFTVLPNSHNVNRTDGKIMVITVLLYIKNLAYDVTVIKWITSCHRLCYDHMLHDTFGGNKNRDGDAC